MRLCFTEERRCYKYHHLAQTKLPKLHNGCKNWEKSVRYCVDNTKVWISFFSFFKSVVQFSTATLEPSNEAVLFIFIQFANSDVKANLKNDLLLNSTINVMILLLLLSRKQMLSWFIFKQEIYHKHWMKCICNMTNLWH